MRTLREIKKIFNTKNEPKIKKWLNGSAEYGHTTDRNENIFRSVGIIPKVLKNFSDSKINTTFFGCKVSSPLIIAPMGGISQFNKKAEFIISECSEKEKIPYFFPNNSCYQLSEINNKLKKNYLCRSLYIDSDLSYCKKNIEDAENYDCKAIAITVDSPVRPVSYNKSDTGYDARKHYKKFGLKKPIKNKISADPLNWKTIEYLRKLTNKPLILKGILSKQDAKVADSLGIDGIWVSNHGGRNLETDITSLEVLEGIRDNINSKTKLIVDGGVRTGSDIFKALALGADFVAVGRPIVYGLSIKKKAGVTRVLELLLNEIKSTMRICGAENLKDIDNSFIVNRLDRLK